MNTITIPKRTYDEIIERQVRTEAAVELLTHKVKKLKERKRSAGIFQ